MQLLCRPVKCLNTRVIHLGHGLPPLRACVRLSRAVIFTHALHSYHTNPQSSTRPIKRSPSEVLVRALAQSGHDWAVPHVSDNKVDLSYIKADAKDLRRKSQKVVIEDESAEAEDFQTVLATFIEGFVARGSNSAVSEVSTESVTKVFNDGTLRLLYRYGYDVPDVVTWAWILTPRNSLRAALRLVFANNTRWSDYGKAHPAFLLSTLLRRAVLAPSALRVLMGHSRDRFDDRYNPDWDMNKQEKGRGSHEAQLEHNSEHMTRSTGSADAGYYVGASGSLASEHIKPTSLEKGSRFQVYPRLNVKAMLIINIRLIRHARTVQPEYLPFVASLFCDHVVERWSSRAVPGTDQLSLICNKILKLLADPCHHHPYLSIVSQQEAQSAIVEKMHSLQPAILVSREGFQAIARVQLAHRKTESERRWAELKSNSWPPWKKDKLGIDATVDVESGRSRAVKVLTSQAMSGYAPDAWDKAAMILAGWDTDGTPTIQTRRILPPEPSPPLEGISKLTERREAGIWATRITATRNVDEAWAIFLSYQASMSAADNVYRAMLQKLLAEDRRVKRETVKDSLDPLDGNQPVPGDGLEITQAPSSPRDKVYTKTAPPDLLSFVSIMERDGIDTRFARPELIRRAQSLEEVVRNLVLAGVDESTIAQLTGKRALRPEAAEEIDSNTGFLESRMDANVFAAFIEALVRLGPSANKKWAYLRRRAQTHALRLLEAGPSTNVPAWIALFRGVSQANAVSGYNVRPALPERLQAWTMMLRAIHTMRNTDLTINSDVFQALCSQFVKVAYESRKALARLPGLKEDWTPGNIGKAWAALQFGAPLLMDAFGSLTGDPLRHSPPESKAPPPDVFDRLPAPERSPAFRNLSEKAIQTYREQGVLYDGANSFPIVSEKGVTGCGQARDSLNETFDFVGMPVISESDDLDNLEESQLAEVAPSALHKPCLRCIYQPLGLLHTPHPATLHGLMRALGAARNHGGILELLRWMRRHAPALDACAAHVANGARMQRRALIHARIGLETDWVRTCVYVGGSGNESRQGRPAKASEEARGRARTLVESVESWGGWPTDKEVEKYLANAA